MCGARDVWDTRDDLKKSPLLERVVGCEMSSMVILDNVLYETGDRVVCVVDLVRKLRVFCFHYLIQFEFLSNSYTPLNTVLLSSTIL